MKVQRATSTPVLEHPYSVRITHQGQAKRWPSLRGFIYEHDVQIGRFERRAPTAGFLPPIEYSFFSTPAKYRFMGFADSLSIEETIEALLP